MSAPLHLRVYFFGLSRKDFAFFIKSRMILFEERVNFVKELGHGEAFRDIGLYQVVADNTQHVFDNFFVCSVFFKVRVHIDEPVK